MEGHIRGAFPGGPSRSAPAPARAGPPRLQRVEDIEASLTRRNVRRRHRIRVRRRLATLVAAMAVAGVVGGVVGWNSHQTREEVSAAQQASVVQDLDISKEVNRTLLQLWKMEDVEAIRNLGRSR